MTQPTEADPQAEAKERFHVERLKAFGGKKMNRAKIAKFLKMYQLDKPTVQEFWYVAHLTRIMMHDIDPDLARESAEWLHGRGVKDLDSILAKASVAKCPLIEGVDYANVRQAQTAREGANDGNERTEDGSTEVVHPDDD